MFFKKKCFKNTLCWIVILSLLLQSFPLPVQANFIEVIKDVLKKFKLPDEIKLTKEGDVKLGDWTLIKCIGERVNLTECNPFSDFKLGKRGEGQVELDIFQPEIPEICELRVPLGPEEELLTKEERLSLSRACSELRRIQRAAVNQTYFAKKIFNKTNPLSECLFVKNCQSVCNLRFGEITYTISILDIAEMFLPIGWVNTLRKVLSFIAKLNKIQAIFKQLNTVLRDGVRLLNDIFQEVAYLKTFYDSREKILAMVEEGTNVAKLFEHYSNNLFNYTRAKSETQTLIRDAQSESIDLMNDLKDKPGVAFLFGEDDSSKDKRKELQTIIDNYLPQLETPNQLILRLKDNGVPVRTTLDRKQNNPLDLFSPSEPTGCYISYSGIPADCSASLSDGTAILECPSIEYGISCAAPRDAYGQNIRSYTFYGPRVGDSCTFQCRGELVDGEWRPEDYWQQPSSCPNIPSRIEVDCWSQQVDCYNKCGIQCNPLYQECQNLQKQGWGWYSNGGGCDFYPWQYWWEGVLYRSAQKCELPYPQEVEEYYLSCDQIDSGVRISCPGDYSFSCAKPGNNWFNMLYGLGGIYENIKHINELPGAIEALLSVPAWLYQPGELEMLKDQYLSTSTAALNEVQSLRTTLSLEISSLPRYWTTTTYAFPGDIQYWTTTSHRLSAISDDQALTQARLTCGYDAELIFFDWDKQIQAIEEADLELLGQLFEYLLTVSAGTAGESLNEPLINFEIEKRRAEVETAANNPAFQQASTTIRQLKGELELLQGNFSDLNEDINSWSQATSTLKLYISNLIDIKNTSLAISQGSLASSRATLSQLIALGITNQDFSNLLTEISQFLGEIEDSIGSYNCPDSNNPEPGFLSQLSCFERTNGRTFEDIKEILTAIEGLEQVTLTFDKISENVSQIKPTLEIPALKIEGGSLDDLLAGQTGVTFGGEGVDSFEEFGEKLFQSPLSFLDELFYGNEKKGIDDYLADIKNYLENLENIAILSQEVLNEIDKIKDEKCLTLDLLIFGNEELRNCCYDLDLILKRDPEDIEKECDDSANTCLLTDKKLITDCQFNPRLTELISELELTGNKLSDDCQFRDTLTSVLIEQKRTIEDLELIANLQDWWKENVCKKIPEKIPSGEMECERGKGCWPEMENNPAYENCLDFAEHLEIEYLTKLLTDEFKELCAKFQYQKALEKDCADFKALKNALEDGCGGDEKDCPRSCLGCKGCRWQESVPDLTENENELEKIRFVCSTDLRDIRTPLEEVMKVYSLLLGLKSSTRFAAGIVTSIEDAKRAYESAQKLITMIKKLPEELEKAWKEPEVEGGFKIGRPECISRPALSYIDGKKITGAEGGPVCPRIDYFFSIIESNFALIRQSLNQIDLLRKEEKYWTIEIGQIRVSLIKTYPLYNEGKGPYYEKVNSLYKQAEEIKTRAQNLWAIATAINFANTNCTCGQSFCEFPFCISGLPLTPSPLINAYCYLVYTLRSVLKRQVEVLEGYLK